MKKLLLTIALATHALGLSAAYPTVIVGTATAAPIIGNAIAEGSNSYVAQLAIEAKDTLKHAFTSEEAANIAFKYGVPATFLTIAIKHPNIARFCFNTVKDTTAGVCSNILEGIDYTVAVGKQAWGNKKNVAKVTGVFGVLLAANYLARGEHSLVGHMHQQGLPGIFPAIADQYDASAKFMASLFEK